ncbi:MAG: TRAP transporter substrate-binding protein DctP [Brevinema sp.]
MMRFSFLFLFVFLSACGMPNKKNPQGIEAMNLNLYHSYPENAATHGAATMMKKIIEDRTKGCVKLYVFAGGIRGGTGRQVAQSIKNDHADFAIVSTEVLEEYNSAFRALTTPFLFDDNEHFHRAMKSPVMQELYQSLASDNIIVLAPLNSGDMSFFSKKHAIPHPEDIAYRKINVPHGTLMDEMIEVLDGLPVHLSDRKTFSAVIDEEIRAGSATPLSFVTNNTKGEIKYYTLTKHTKTMNFLIVNKKTWDGFSDELRESINDSIDELSEAYHSDFAKREDEILELDSKYGFMVHRDVDVEAFRSALQPMYDTLFTDPFFSDIIRSVISYREK